MRVVLAAAVATVCVVAATALLWVAGEVHRENCIRADKIDCSVLPWKDGHYPVDPFANPFDALDGRVEAP